MSTTFLLCLDTPVLTSALRTPGATTLFAQRSADTDGNIRTAPCGNREPPNARTHLRQEEVPNVTVTPSRLSAHLSRQDSGEKWRTVDSALGSWSKTAQFCVMAAFLNLTAIGSVAAFLWLTGR